MTSFDVDADSIDENEHTRACATAVVEAARLHRNERRIGHDVRDRNSRFAPQQIWKTRLVAAEALGLATVRSGTAALFPFGDELDALDVLEVEVEVEYTPALGPLGQGLLAAALIGGSLVARRRMKRSA